MMRSNPRMHLLLDIDGVIHVMGPGCEQTFTVTIDHAPIRICVNTPARIRRLAAVYRLRWSSSWEQASNLLCPTLGIPEMGWVPFGDEARVGENWKLPGVERAMRDKPFAVVDDDFDDDVLAWAAKRAAPTLVIRTDPRYGLTDEHVDELLRFEAEHRGA